MELNIDENHQKNTETKPVTGFPLIAPLAAWHSPFPNCADENSERITRVVISLVV